jgi:hypothetical protein
VKPEEALARAREQAAQAGYDTEDLRGFEIAPTDRITTEQLMEWAVIEPEIEDKVRSTRRGGAPITWVKRTLVHLLRQYHGDVLAQQARFNLHLLVRVAELEDRIARLEEGDKRERPPGP